MHKEIALTCGCGIASALMYSAGNTGSGLGVMLANFAILPLVMIGLASNARRTTITALAGIIGVVAFSNLLVGGIYSVTVAFPAWIVARCGLVNRATASGGHHWYPVGRILALIAGYGALVLILAALASFDAEDGLKGAVTNMLG